MVGNQQQQQRKGRWMKEEDRTLKRLVAEYSVDGEDIDWSVLEQHFRGTRDSKQIRERWVNHLNPSIKKRKFNDNEIKIIEEECSKHKFKWAKISKKIPNATPLMIKNFYNNRLKKKNPTRRLSDSSTASYTTNIYNFNTTTNTTTTNTSPTPTPTHTTNINYLNNSNNNNPNIYDNNEYLSTKDISYYSETTLRRNSSIGSVSTNRTFVSNSNLSRSCSTRTTNSLSTLVDNSPLLSSELSMDSHNEKLNSHNGSLDFLATVAGIVSHGHKVELPSPTDSPIKPEKMSIRNIINS